MNDAVELAELLLAEPDVELARLEQSVLALTLAELGRHLGDHPSQAIMAIQRVEDMAAAIEAHDIEARAIYVRARATAASGDFTTALGLIRRAAAAFRACSLMGAALRTNLGLAHVLNESGRHVEALSACDSILDALAIDPPPDLDTDERLQLGAAAEQNRGLCFELTGRWVQALEAYANAEVGYSDLGQASSIGEVRNNRGLVLLALGRIAEAQEAFGDALAMLDEDDRPLRALALNGLAETLLAHGQYVACLDTLAEAKSLLDEVDAPLPELDRTLSAARAYEALNLHREALATYEEAAAFFDKGGLTVEAARATWGAARIRLAMGDAARAASDLAGVVDTFREADHQPWLALALLDRAATSRSLGAFAEALADARAASSISQASSAPLELVRSELAVADLLQRDDDDAATAAIERAAAVLDDVDLAPLSLLVAQAQGLHLLRQGRFDRAREPLERAASTAERLHDVVDGAAVGQRFMLDKLDAFDGLIELAAHDPSLDDDRRGVAVLDATERARRRRLGGLDMHRTVSGMIADDDGLSGELDAVYAEMLTPGHTDRERFARLSQRVAELELRLSRAALDKLRPVRGQARSQAKAHSRQPPGGETVLSWYCLQDEVIALVLAGDAVVYRPLSTCRDDVIDAIDRLDAQWQHFHADQHLSGRHHDRFERACRVVLGELHEMLVAPVSDLLPTAPAAPLVIAAHGPLQRVPVHAMHDGSRYLVERFTISTTPSVSDFVTRSALKHEGGGRSLVIAASDATTPAMEGEAHAVAAHLGDVSLHVGDDATSTALMQGAPGAAVLHIACHALFRRDNPMFSSLRLADRSIRANQLLDLDLSSALVTLSSCDSARSHGAHGEELVGFTRSVLGAGARTLVASLWPADDGATRHIMDRFYGELDGTGPAIALRAAQLEQLGRTPHPYFWAPFIVIGGR
ncbi:MAG: CHAT domain-containing protein [Ilumatobacteraceae bacterium]